MTQPLVVASPDKQAAVLEKLLQIRASKTLSLKPTPMLRTEIVGPSGTPIPFRLRYYQVQGIFHLLMLRRMVLGDGTGLGKCLIGDTLLTTNQGLIPLQELAPLGELVEDTFYEPRVPVQVWTGHEMTPVRRFYWNGTVPTLKVTTRNGFRVEGSLVHPVRVRDADGEGFKKLPDVEAATDYVCIDRSKAPFPESEPRISVRQDLHHNAKQFTYLPYLTSSLARLLGYVVAEAWTNGKYATNISQHADVNPEAHADIRKLLLDVFGWEGNDGCVNRETLISVNSIGIRQYLEACGVTYTTARFKEVPWCILRGSELSVREFLRGLFEGEASVVEGGVEFTSSSEKLIRTVHVLLLRFGIVATLSPKWVEGYDHTYWRLTFFGEGARTFADDIGFVSSRKNDALDASLKIESNPNKDVVPYMGLTVASLKDAILESASKTGSNDDRRGSGLKQYGESFQSTLKHVIHGKRNATYRFLRQLLEVASGYGLNEHLAFKDVRAVVRQHYYYDPVVQIDEGRAPLMDIEVEHADHCFSGNGVINHNTIEMLGALCYLWERETKNKVIVVTPKSALRQWAGEVERFTIGVKVFVVSGKVDERRAIWQAWAKHSGPEKALLIVNYSLIMRDWDFGAKQGLNAKGKPDPKNITPGMVNGITRGVSDPIVVIYDEATAFKNTSTKTWQVCKFLSDRAHRCYGLTATLLKNNLMEGFGIYKVIHPTIFTTKTAFLGDYCVVKLQSVAGGRKIPIVVGYKNLQHFRARIDPYFLGRPKHTVSDELPTLITKEIICELGDTEDAKYQEALSGVLELGDGDIKDFEEHKAFVSLIYCQQVVNSLTMLKFTPGDNILTGIDVIDGSFKEGLKVKDLGAKEDALVELLSDELDGEKTIVYTRFASLVPRLQQILKDNKIKSVCITGKQNDKQREDARVTFQNVESDTKVIFITDAGSEAINLQAASAMVFYDAPWSWGVYVQLLGRPIRIGSVHQSVVVYHLISERPAETKKDRKTIDRYVLDMLGKKKDLIDKVIGEAAVGALDFEKGSSAARTLVRNLQGKE